MTGFEPWTSVVYELVKPHDVICSRYHCSVLCTTLERTNRFVKMSFRWLEASLRKKGRKLTSSQPFCRPNQMDCFVDPSLKTFLYSYQLILNYCRNKSPWNVSTSSFLNMAQSAPLFVYFCSFHNPITNKVSAKLVTQMEKTLVARRKRTQYLLVLGHSL